MAEVPKAFNSVDVADNGIKAELSRIHDEEGEKYGDFLSSVVAGQEHSGDENSQFSDDIEAAILEAGISSEDRKYYQRIRKSLFSFNGSPEFDKSDVGRLESFFGKVDVAFNYLLNKGYLAEQLRTH